MSYWTFGERPARTHGLGQFPLLDAILGLATPLVGAGVTVYEGQQTRKIQKKEDKQNALLAQAALENAAQQAEQDRIVSAQRWESARSLGQQVVPYAVAVGSLGAAALVISSLMKRRGPKVTPKRKTARSR